MVFKYNILIVENNDSKREELSNYISNCGYNQINFKSSEQAINYLNATNDKGYQNHKDITLILSNIENSDLLYERNQTDNRIPFYFLREETEPKNFEILSKRNVSGFLKLDEYQNILDGMLSKVLAINYSGFKKQPILFKIGGSADDFDHETIWKSLVESLEFGVKLQENYQVIYTSGAGVFGDRIKSEYKKYSDDYPFVKNGLSHRMSEALDMNLKGIKNKIWDDSIYRTPKQFTGEEPFMINNNPNLITNPTITLDDFFNQDKILLIGELPRHLLQGYEHLTKEKHSYPLIPGNESDAITILLANFFNLDKIGIIKRTDWTYKFDPRKGLEKNIDKWKKTQKNNSKINRLTHDEFLNKKTKKGYKISFIGAEDGEDGHFFEDIGIELAKKFGIEIGIAPINSNEMYHNSKHIIPPHNQKPKISAKEIREKQMLNIIKGKNLCIVNDY